MTKIIHRAESRGKAEHGWLHSFHTFSFAGYHDPDRMGFGTLRVLNDDVVQAGQGFGTHPHDNMEIISIPLAGALRHKDSMGNVHVIRTGEVQVMSAGTGITHSEYNDSDDAPVNFLQIWILPKNRDISPRYEQSMFDVAGRQNRFQLVVSPDGRDQSLVINQDAYFSLAQIEQGETAQYSLQDEENGTYLFILEGHVEVAGEQLDKRDALGLWDNKAMDIHATESAQILCIEVTRIQTV